MAKIVVALGGNALGNSVIEQIEQTRIAAKAIVDLIANGHEVLIGHGNGPQVGQIKLAFDEGEKSGTSPHMPFAECTAMSQGYIGYHLQTAIEAELVARGMSGRQVVALITRVLVDLKDSAFCNPTKPVGGYYDEESARKMMQKTGEVYAEDAGRGWRRMVASPIPVDILEKSTVTCLLDNNCVVIAGGGGGIPVAVENDRYVSVAAVVDKDFAAARLAGLINADMLLILTAVERVSINFRKPNEEALAEMTLAQARKYCDEGHFAPGSMLPKIKAACMFVESGQNRRAIIASLDKAALALRGESGTVVF